MPKDSEIAVGGENLIDHVDNDGEVTAHVGGSPFNVSMALGRQLANVRYVSPISTDNWGNLLCDSLTGSGVRLTGGRNSCPTTMARVKIAGGIPSYAFERDGTAERQVDNSSLNSAIGAETKVLHTGSLTLTDGDDADIWEAVLADAFDSGTLISVDPNVRLSVISDFDGYRQRIIRILKKTHLLKLSDEDLEALFPHTSQSDAIDELLGESHANLVVLTKGESGISAWFDGNRIDRPAAPASNLQDTVGAGDTFMATLLASIAKIGPDPVLELSRISENPMATILDRAATAAALNCERIGCDPPTVSELDAAIATRT